MGSKKKCKRVNPDESDSANGLPSKKSKLREDKGNDQPKETNYIEDLFSKAAIRKRSNKCDSEGGIQQGSVVKLSRARDSRPKGGQLTNLSNRNRKKGKSHDLKHSPSKERSKDGLKIYTCEELNMGNGGDTDKCPFDCDCCF